MPDELEIQTNGPRDLTGTFLLPGTTAPGVAALTDVAIDFDLLFNLLIVPDGSGRIVGVVNPPDPDDSDFSDVRSLVFDPAAVLSVGAGAEAPAPDLPGFVTTADLGDAEAALVATLLGDEQAELRVVQGSVITVLTTVPERFPLAELTATSTNVLAGPDGRFVELAYGTSDELISYRWSLDAPCGDLSEPVPTEPATPTATDPPPAAPTAPMPAAAPTPAPAAAPIATEAAFTG